MDSGSLERGSPMPDSSPKPKPARPPRKPGRKPTPITLAQVEACGRLCMTQEEIGDFFGLSQSAISRRFASDSAFAEAYRRGKAHLRKRLRAAQIRSAIDQGNVIAQIFLGKQLLGQSDKTEERQQIDVTHSHVFIAQWGKSPGELPGRVDPSAPPPDCEDVIEGVLDPEE